MSYGTQDFFNLFQTESIFDDFERHSVVNLNQQFNSSLTIFYTVPSNKSLLLKTILLSIQSTVLQNIQIVVTDASSVPFFYVCDIWDNIVTYHTIDVPCSNGIVVKPTYKLYAVASDPAGFSYFNIVSLQKTL